MLSLAYCAVQFLAFHALTNLAYLFVSFLAYFVKRYLAYSVLQLVAFPAYPSKKPPPTVASVGSKTTCFVLSYKLSFFLSEDQENRFEYLATIFNIQDTEIMKQYPRLDRLHTRQTWGRTIDRRFWQSPNMALSPKGGLE